MTLSHRAYFSAVLLLSALLRAQAPTQPDLIAPEMVAAIEQQGLTTKDSQVMAMLQRLTGMGHRLSGSDNFTLACGWAVEQFERIGLPNAHLEKWATWNLIWNRGKWIGRITDPIQLDMYVATDAWTAGTQGLVKARIVPAPKTVEEAEAMGESLRGVFLFTGDKRARGEVRKYCEGHGIAGFAYDAYGDAKYPDRVRVFGMHQTAMGKLADVPTIPEIAIQHDHAQQLAQLLDAGKEVTVEFDIQNEFKQGPVDLCNVVAEIPGTDKPDEVVIVCGHLDSWHQAEGCTDNGTGVTTTLEAARILTTVGARPKRTIRFILWGGEEQGLLGSLAYVRQHRAEMAKVSCVFNHDTGTNWAHRLTVSDAMFEPMQRVLAPVMKLQAPDPDFTDPVFVLIHKPSLDSGMGGSDHASFFTAKVPGLDWSLAGRSDYFGMTWHSQWDNFDVAIPEYQRHTSTVVALCALGVANLPELLDHEHVAEKARGGQSNSIAQAIFDAEMDGMKFTAVHAGGRAEKMGVKPGDLVVKINGKPVTQIFEMFPILRDEAPDELVFTLQYDGTADGAAPAAKLLREVRLQASEITGGRASNPFDAEMDGMTFKLLKKGGRGDALGIVPRDRLLQINGQDVGDLRAVRAILRDETVTDLVLVLARGPEKVTIRAEAAALRARKE